MMVPCKCPVCDGRGTVPRGFYDQSSSSSGTVRDKCKSCSGTGLVWAVGSSPDDFKDAQGNSAYPPQVATMQIQEVLPDGVM